jgi:hypothetical protein
MRISNNLPGRGLAYAALCAAFILPGLASAQVPALVEGKISYIQVNDVASGGDGSVDMTVMGIKVHIPAAVFASSLASTPTGTITNPNDLLGDPLPGRADSGFLGGTAIINGESTTASDGAGGIISGFTAIDLFVEPAENVVLGSIQNDGACGLSIEGVPLVFLKDPRMTAADPVNTSGFLIDHCQTLNGGAAAVEGYYGENGMLYVFTYETDDAPLLDTGAGGTTTITRASCDGRRIEVRGSSTLSAGEARLYAFGSDVVMGADALLFDTVTGTSTYRIRVNVAGCPDQVTVESWNDATPPAFDSSVTAPVDIR